MTTQTPGPEYARAQPNLIYVGDITVDRTASLARTPIGTFGLSQAVWRLDDSGARLWKVPIWAAVMAVLFLPLTFGLSLAFLFVKEMSWGGTARIEVRHGDHTYATAVPIRDLSDLHYAQRLVAWLNDQNQEGEPS